MLTRNVESNQRAPEAHGPPIIAAEQIRAHYANMPGAFIGSAVTASFMAAVLDERLPTDAVLSWLAAAYLNCGVRFGLWKAFRRANPSSGDMPRWGRYSIVSGAFAGLIWGASGLVLNIPGNLSDQVVVLLVTTGLAFTSTHLSAAFLPAYRAFAYPAFALAALPFLLGHDALHVVTGLGTLALLPLVLRYASRLSRTLRESIAVRLRNAELVEELRAQKKAAEDANIAKSRFLAVASHDLRQPLHALTLFVDALQDLQLPAHAQHLVGNVRRSVDSMEELFDALLDISRLDAGAVRPRIEVIPLADVLDHLSFEYALVAKQKGVSLRVARTSLHVRSDPTLLTRILRNLVANAVRYTEHGRVTIGCRRRGERVRVEVWDTGPGIADEKRVEIFQEFTQLGNPDRDRRKGLGLGLAIVERLARLLGHEVELRSRVGKGSMFAVCLARGRHDEAALLEPVAGPTARFDLTGRLALLIQKELAGRRSLQELLGAWNCEVIAAASGAEILTQLGGLRRRPDLIIADGPLQGLKGESGPAIVEMLRGEFNSDVPALLVMSAAGPDTAAAVGGEHAGLPVLHRPFNPARLRTLIDSVLHAPVVRARRAG